VALHPAEDDASYATWFIGRLPNERIELVKALDDADVAPHLSRVFGGAVANAGTLAGLTGRISESSAGGVDVFVSARGEPHAPHKFIPAMLLDCRSVTRERARIADLWLARTALTRGVTYDADASFDRAPFHDKGSLTRAIEGVRKFFEDATAQSLEVESQTPQTERGEPPMGFVAVTLRLRRACGGVKAALSFTTTGDADHARTEETARSVVAALATELGLHAGA
jgi:hypothetical protein